MSQHDMVIADAPGATVRADINSMGQALASTSKGPSAPSTPYAGQLWLDDDTPSSTVWTLNQYDGADWIELGKIDSTNNRFSVKLSQGADVASASTINLDASYGTVVDVTGTTTITAVTLAQGQVRIVRFTGALTFTHGASLVLPGAANITTAAGDYAILAGYASSVVRCVGYFRADAAPHSTGTWTPAFTSTSATFGYTHQIGRYVKTGKLVHLEYRILLSGAPGGTTSNSVFLSGIPFTCGTTTDLYFGGHVGHYMNINLASGTSLAWQGQSGGTSFELKEVGDNLGETSLLASTLGSAAEIRGSISYISA